MGQLPSPLDFPGYTPAPSQASRMVWFSAGVDLAAANSWLHPGA